MDVLAGTFNNVYVYGGYSGTGSATGNTATISGGTVSKVYGGNSKGGNVTSNNVVITGGAVGNAWGGYFYSSKAETKNTVTISGGTVERVYGGESANGDVEANTVAITGGTVQGYASLVYGGSSTYGAAKNNQVNISAGTVNTTFGVKGGRSQYGDATGNTVTISGGTITGKVVGGASNNTATDNKVILAKGAAAANLNNATLYGSTRSNGDSLPTTHDGNTLTVGGETNITVATVKNFDVYDFKLGDVENGDVILNLLNDTDLGKVDVKVEDTSAITGKRKIYLMKLANGKTLAFTAGDGTTTYADDVSQNAKKTATLTKTRKVEQEDNNLLLVDNIAYDFGLTPDTMKNGYIFITPADTGNTGATTIDATDVTLNKAGIDGRFLSLSKGDKVYLLKNTADGTLTYTGTNGENQTLNHTHTNDAKDATVTTTGEVAADGNDLVLKIDGVKYNFILAPTTADGDTFLTSENTGKTKIDRADMTLNDEALDGKVLALSKGDKVYLLKNDTTTGTLEYTGNDTDDRRTYTYNNTAGDASIVTKATVRADDNDLVLNVDGVTYTYKLTVATKNGDTFITSPHADDTKIDGADVKLDLDATNSDVLSLSKGDKVYLLKKSNGTLAYTETGDAPALKHTYTNDDGTATIETTGTVQSDGKSLVLNVDDVKYIFTLSSATKTDGTPMLMLTNAADTKIDASDVVLADSAEPLSLQKGDTVTLLTKDSTAGALTFADMAGKAQRTSVYTKTGEAGSAAITTTGTLAQDGKSLVMKVDGVKYTFALAPAAKADDTLLELEYTGDTTISKGDVTVKTSGFLRKLAKGDKVYLLKKTNGKLIATDITDTVNLPTIYGTIEGTVAEDASNNLVLTVTNAESLTDAGDSYKYIKVVEVPAENAGNTITVEACGNADRSAIAALAKDETDATELKDNTLTVQGKVKGRAVGANSVAGNATENNVTIGAGATVDGFVAGGLTADGTANGNIVTINGGTITGDVYGGYSEKEAKDNTVELAGGTIKGTVYGGYVPDASAATSVRSKRSMPRRTLAATASSTSGNTLNVTKATTVGNLAKFDTYNFYLPAGTSNGATMLHLMDNADTDMTNSTVNVKASGALNLYNNENVYLIKKEGGSLLTDGMTTNVGEANVLIGVTAELTCAVENKDNNLVLNVTKGPEKPSSSSSSGGSSSSSSSSGSGSSGSSSESSNTSSTENANSASSSGNASSSGSSSSASTPRVTINPDTKSAVETRAAQSNVVNMGSDYFVDTTLPQIAGLAYGADGFGAFGGSSGSAHMRYKTGSHVDSRGTAFNAGIAKKNANKSGAFTWGPFFETGHGNYDSYLDNGTHVSGSTSYTGGGLFARQEFASGLYVEGSLRTGKTKADYSSSDLGTSYSTDAPYFGAHLGATGYLGKQQGLMFHAGVNYAF